MSFFIVMVNAPLIFTIANKCQVISANFSIPWYKIFNSRTFVILNSPQKRKGEASTLSSERKVRISEKRENVLEELLVCSRCDICLQGFAALCDVMCSRLRNCKRGSGAYRKDFALLVLALSVPT